MNDSILNLDIALEYLNNGRTVDPITYLYETIIKESNEFNSVINEGIDFERFKESALNFAKKVLKAIKTFINWIKDKIIGFFTKISRLFIKIGGLKEKLKELKKKKESVSESTILYEAVSPKEINDFLSSQTKIFANPHEMKVLIDTALDIDPAKQLSSELTPGENLRNIISSFRGLTARSAFLVKLVDQNINVPKFKDSFTFEYFMEHDLGGVEAAKECKNIENIVKNILTETTQSYNELKKHIEYMESGDAELNSVQDLLTINNSYKHLKEDKIELGMLSNYINYLNGLLKGMTNYYNLLIETNNEINKFYSKAIS